MPLGCGCLVALISAFSARLALLFVWLFTDRLTIAFRHGWEGVLGFIFFPYATLFYALAYQPGKGLDGLGWFVVVLGFLLDMYSGVFSSRGRRGVNRRYERYPGELS